MSDFNTILLYACNFIDADSDEDEVYDVPEDLVPKLIDESKVDKTKRRVYLGAGTYGKVETIWYGGDQCVIKTMIGSDNVDGFMKEARFLFQVRLNVVYVFESLSLGQSIRIYQVVFLSILK